MYTNIIRTSPDKVSLPSSVTIKNNIPKMRDRNTWIIKEIKLFLNIRFTLTSDVNLRG
jgi:hypothetical protein